MATTGGSPIKPTEVALLEVDSVAALTKATPEDWQVLKKATQAEVRSRGLLTPRHVRVRTQMERCQCPNHFASAKTFLR